MNNVEHEIYDIIKHIVCDDCNAGQEYCETYHQKRCNEMYKRQAKAIYKEVFCKYEDDLR